MSVDSLSVKGEAAHEKVQSSAETTFNEECGGVRSAPSQSAEWRQEER